MISVRAKQICRKRWRQTVLLRFFCLHKLIVPERRRYLWVIQNRITGDDGDWAAVKIVCGCGLLFGGQQGALFDGDITATLGAQVIIRRLDNIAG
jgi:hypothetical protein